MKRIVFEPINESLTVATGSDLLQALVAKNCNVLMACGGKGLCATCHVHVRQGMDKLTPPTPREVRTLSYITGADPGSRLACQCKVLGEGVVVELPEGMYIERVEDLLSLVGKRAEIDVLHPITGSVLIAKGKIITRGRIEQLQYLNEEVQRLKTAAN